MNSALRCPPSLSASLSDHAANVMARNFPISWRILLRPLRWTMAGLLIGAVLCSVFRVHPASHCGEHRQNHSEAVVSSCHDCPNGTEHPLPLADDHSCSCDCLCQTMIHVATSTLLMDPGIAVLLTLADPPLNLKSVVLEPDPPPVRRA